LGLLSKRAKQAIEDNVMNCWAKRGARAHGETWFTHPLKASTLLAKLFHVLPEEIVIA
jgi:kynureninase